MAGVGLLCLRGAPEVSKEIVGTLEQGPSWGTSGTLLHFLVALPGRDLHAFLPSIPHPRYMVALFPYWLCHLKNHGKNRYLTVEMKTQ